MIILPALALACVYLVFRKSGLSRGPALLGSAATWGALLTAMTELLSIPSLLLSGWVAGGWAIVAALAFLCWRRLPGAGVEDERGSPPREGRVERILQVGIAVVAGCTGALALVAAPNNYDSMTYHLARVVHWVQNASVEYYPTTITRQLHQSPWAEFAILHLQLLSGGDRFANLVQWLAMVGCLVGAYLISTQLGGGRRAGMLAAVVCVTLPMGIVQASSTQNDYVASLWLVCFVFFGFRVLEAGPGRTPASWSLWALAGASLGLAILTKATSYLFALPFLVWWGGSLVQRQRARALRPLLVIGGMALVINLGQYWRNWDLYRWPLGPPWDQARYANQLHTPAVLASNLVRNVGLHVGTPIGQVDEAGMAAVERFHQVLGIASDDPRTTWHGTRFFIVGPSTQEDIAGNPIHLALLLGCLVVVVATSRGRTPQIVGYAAALTAAFLLFCFYLKWQPWHSRLHLPLFVLASPLIAVVLAPRLTERTLAGFGGLLLLASLPWVVANQTRPLLGERSVLTRSRIDQYFNNNPGLRDPYLGAAQLLARERCADVGLLIGSDSYEYPLWKTLSDAAGRDVRLHHVGVANPSSTLQERSRARSSRPCAVVRVDPLDGSRWREPGSGYSLQWSSGPVAVFLPDAVRQANVGSPLPRTAPPTPAGWARSADLDPPVF